MRALAIALVATGCTHVTSDFTCATDADCTSASGTAGRCEASRRCSYTDTSCSSGFRYGDLAGDTSNQCTSIDDCVGEVRAGALDTCVRRGDGTVWCWGNGMLGASQVTMPAGTIAQLDDAGAGMCARYGDGKLHCASGPAVGDIAVSGRDVAVGTSHVCAITSDGHVACWGDNSRGELGDNTMATRPAPANVVGLSGATQLASGLETSCAIISGGQVWCWGDDSRGEIGRGVSLDQFSLVPLMAQGTTGFASIAVGDRFACGATSSGAVWCWGNNDAGQCGQGTNFGENDSPVLVASLAGIVAITAGGGHACALGGDGKVWCWGANGSHETAAASATSITTPTLVVDGNGAPILFHDVDAGARHTCGRTAANGSVMCWGDNAMGQIGDGTFATAIRPTAAGLACR